MRYYVIAGEASGDLHASHLIRELFRLDPKAEVQAWGGDLSSEAGAKVVKHYRDLAFMGFWEVAKNIRTILKNFKICKADILQFKPDALILVDYPGFNLRIAEWAKAQGIKVFYYISPQVWAWKTKRVHKIKRIVDELFVILPFESDFYKSFGMDVSFVGHPLMDVIPNYSLSPHFRETLALNPSRPVIALLPGSRKQEIKRMLSPMLELVDHFPAYQFLIAGAPAIPKSFYSDLIGSKPVQLIQNQTYDVLKVADLALITSGTATLEAGLFKVPQVVCYTGNPASYWLAKRLIKVKYICLVNLILDRPVVRELIQYDFSLENLRAAIQDLLQTENRKTLESAYQELASTLGGSGASKRVAEQVYSKIKK